MDIDVGGRGVHLVEKGAGSPLVLLHGTGLNAAFFLPLPNHLAGIRAIVPDRPGQGLSDSIDLPRDRYFDAAIEWVDRFLDALELNTIVLLGHSAGGVWALRYALAHPDRVERLVLIRPPALPKTRWPLPYRLIATPGSGELLPRLAPPSPKSVLQFASFMGESATISDHPDLIDLIVAANRDPAAAAVQRAETRLLASPLALISPRGFRHHARVRRDELRRLTMPTLIMWSERELLGRSRRNSRASFRTLHCRCCRLATSRGLGGRRRRPRRSWTSCDEVYEREQRAPVGRLIRTLTRREAPSRECGRRHMIAIDIATDVVSQSATRLNGLESAVHEDDSNQAGAARTGHRDAASSRLSRSRDRRPA